MARNTTEKTTSNRSKKAATSKPPSAVQVGSENPVAPVSEVPKKVKSRVAPINVEEQIRRRAYELYLERRATAGYGNGGDENRDWQSHDWLIAEREVRSRQGDQGQQTA